MFQDMTDKIWLFQGLVKYCSTRRANVTQKELQLQIMYESAAAAATKLQHCKATRACLVPRLFLQSRMPVASTRSSVHHHIYTLSDHVTTGCLNGKRHLVLPECCVHYEQVYGAYCTVWAQGENKRCAVISSNQIRSCKHDCCMLSRLSIQTVIIINLQTIMHEYRNP